MKKSYLTRWWDMSNNAELALPNRKKTGHFRAWFWGIFCLAAISPVRADQTVPPAKPFQGAVELLDGFITQQVADKNLPALSIALVDDQKIVWAQGLRLPGPRQESARHRRDGLPRRLGLQAVHRPRRHAARRAGQARPRRPGHQVPARLQADQPVRQADHAAAADVAPLRPGPRAAGRQLLRSRPTRRSPRRSRASTAPRSSIRPEARIKYSNAAIATVGYVLEKTQKQAVRRLPATRRCSSRSA